MICTSLSLLPRAFRKDLVDGHSLFLTYIGGFLASAAVIVFLGTTQAPLIPLTLVIFSIITLYYAYKKRI
jgi:hypothetical protein